ncbi:MAG: DUF2950 domain-containing protein [Candidatus Sulfotelmatobacter sp.]
MYHNRGKFDSGILGAMAVGAIFSMAMASVALPAAAQQTGQETFPSAGKASHALVAALKAEDQATLLKILGPDAKDIVSSGDPVEDKDRRAEFVQKYEQMHRLVTEPDGKTTLYIGAENWPTPIPLVHKGNAWYFDTPAGKEEILYRRVGRNELAVIQVCGELVDAEKEYYGQPHDGSSAHVYADKFMSDPGKHDGLYWEASVNENESPIGPMLAQASAMGNSTEQMPQPFHGYYFRILKGQKSSSGTKSYMQDGKMTGGFAFLAYPAQYRSSGVMTFIVDQNGIVYEKDLGKRTPEIAKTLTVYSRDKTWRKAD